jgi:hypothetical protein
MSEPSIEDFRNLLEGDFNKRLDRLQTAIVTIDNQATSTGLGGNAIHKSLEALEAEFEGGVRDALVELKSVMKKGVLGQAELRLAAGDALAEFATRAKATIRRERWRRHTNRIEVFVNDRFAKMDQHLQSALRHFDTSLRIPSDPEVPDVTNNSINVGSMTGSTIQQGCPGANQTVTRINIDEARAAVADLEARLADLTIPAKTRSDIQSDLETIKAQFAKSTPSHPIIREATRSIRGVFEGVIADMVSPAATAAVMALGKVTGAF